MPPISRDMPKPNEAPPSRRPVVLADRFRIERTLEDGRYEAVDTTRGKNVIVTRVPFGPGGREARDLLIERVRALWTVTAPALVLPIDAGLWDDDAYVIEEPVEAPFTTLSGGLSRLDTSERASAARNVADAIAALHGAGFVHGDLSLETILLDGYRQPKIHAANVAMRSSTESERAEDLKLRPLLDQIAPGLVSTAREGATARELARAIPELDPMAGPPLVVVPGAPGWQGMTVLAICLALVALIAAGWLIGRYY